MKNHALSLVVLLASLPAHADQAASWTCTGEKIRLASRTPYLGDDNARFAQTLYVLQPADIAGESTYTAYFLDVKENATNRGEVVLHGENAKGGDFTVLMGRPRETGDGGVIRREAEASISYDHGPLHGTSEPVRCVFE